LCYEESTMVHSGRMYGYHARANTVATESRASLVCGVQEYLYGFGHRGLKTDVRM
jgi:hypothetical protein